MGSRRDQQAKARCLEEREAEKNRDMQRQLDYDRQRLLQEECNGGDKALFFFVKVPHSLEDKVPFCGAFLWANVGLQTESDLR
jgi:hypothetical protein